MPDGILIGRWDSVYALVDLMLDVFRKDINALRADIGDLKSGIGSDFGDLASLLTALRGDVAAVQSDVGVLKTDVGTLKTDVSTARTNITTLQTNVSSLQTSVTSLLTRVGTLETTVAGLNVWPITFVFGGVPAVNSMINVPLTQNLSITAANLSSQSRYYNAVNPQSSSTFRLYRITATGAMTTIGTVSINNAGQGSFSGTGSTVLAAGDTLRMTAITVGADLTDVAISIYATRR